MKEQLFNKIAERLMHQWNAEYFKKTHPRLLTVILESMEEYASVKNNDPLHSVSCCFYIFEEMDSNGEFGCIASSIEEAKDKLVNTLKLDVNNLGYKCSHELIQ